jgi:flagellar basal-body rod protein FlgG
VVQRGDENLYTRDGSFKLSPMDEGLMLVTSDGYPVLGTDDAPIIFDHNVIFSDVTIDEFGMMYYIVDNVVEPLDMQVMLVQFPNAQGLESVGGNFLRVTSASGEPLLEAEGEVNRVSRLIQGVLEMSNVQVADEMVNLIVAQRAYDLNSKAISTSDDMLNTANNLKR